MSEVARQYNLIGETLRQGIQGMLDSKLDNKALDLQAKKMGVEQKQRKFENTMKLQEFRNKQSLFDENLKVMQLAGQQADADKAKLKAAEEQKNRGSTRFTIGFDTEIENKIGEAKIFPEMKKMGIELRMVNGKENFYDMSTNKIIPDGELASNADVAALLVKHMDVDLILEDNLKLEMESLESMQEQYVKAKQKGAPEAGSLETAIAVQKNRIQQITDKIGDRAAKPVRYLNYKINVMNELMQRARNPEFHKPFIESLIAERNAELKLLEAQLKARGEGSKIKWTYHDIYDENNDIVDKIAVMDGITVSNSPTFQLLEKTHGKKLYAGKRESVASQYDIIGKIHTTTEGAATALRTYLQKGPVGLSELFRGYAASAGINVPFEPMKEATTRFLSWGITPESTPQEMFQEFIRQVDLGLFGKSYSELPKAEQKRLTAPYMATIIGHAKGIGDEGFIKTLKNYQGK